MQHQPVILLFFSCVIWSGSWWLLRSALDHCVIVEAVSFSSLYRTFASRMIWYLVESILPLSLQHNCCGFDQDERNEKTQFCQNWRFSEWYEQANAGLWNKYCMRQRVSNAEERGARTDRLLALNDAWTAPARSTLWRQWKPFKEIQLRINGVKEGAERIYLNSKQH